MSETWCKESCQGAEFGQLWEIWEGGKRVCVNVTDVLVVGCWYFVGLRAEMSRGREVLGKQALCSDVSIRGKVSSSFNRCRPLLVYA